MDEAQQPLPADKIVCQGRYLRYVVACMQNCPSRNHCREFWAFFRERGISPAEYFNRDGIGEAIMKRIVFDCDRCGKKDIGEPWTIYRTSGPDEGKRIAPEEVRDVFARAGSLGCSDAFLGSILDLLHADQGWEHYCDPCFRKVASLAGAIVGKPPKPVVATESAMSETARALSGGSGPRPVVPPPPLPEPEDEYDEAPSLLDPTPAPRKRGRPPAKK